MEDFDDIPERLTVLLHCDKAEKFVGVVWRKATEEEMDELTEYYAQDDLQGEKNFFGEELDDVEELIKLQKIKAEIYQEMAGMTMVQDFKNYNAQIFYSFSFQVNQGEYTLRCWLTDGMTRLLKHKGVLKTIEEDDFLFEV